MRSMFNGAGVSRETSPSAPGQAPSGMAMMLKSMLGIDPAQIMEAATAIKNGVEGADARLTRLGERVEELLVKVERIENHLLRPVADRYPLDLGGDGATAGHAGIGGSANGGAE